MEHEIRHDLDPAQAQRIARQAMQSYAERFAKYHPEVQWRSESQAEIAFTVKGIRLTGGIVIEANRFRFSLDVPFVLRPFKGRAFATIDAEVQQWLAKAKSGQV